MYLRIKNRIKDCKSTYHLGLKVKHYIIYLRKALKRYKKIKHLSTSDFVARNEANWHIVYHKSIPSHPPVNSLGTHKVDFSTTLANNFPEMGILEIDNAYVKCPQGWVYSSNNILLPEFSWYGMSTNEMDPPLLKSKPVAIKGVVLNLLSDFAGLNYGHFLLDSIGRIHLFDKSGFSITDCDYVLCPGKPNNYKLRLLERFNIPRVKCIWSDDYPAITADKLLCPSFPGTRRNYPGWLAPFLRSSLKSNGIKPHKRLFVSRQRSSRKISNMETDIKPILEKYNFEIYYPEDNNNPAEDFSQANIVIGAHGAGLTDIVYCTPGTKFLELIPSDHIYPYYYTLASSAKLNYFTMLGKSEKDRRKTAHGPSPYDFHLDANEFEEAIEHIINFNEQDLVLQQN